MGIQVIGFNLLVIMMILLTVLILIIIEFITRSYIFIKAGEKGYKCFIPFYSGYTFYNVAQFKKAFYVALPFMIVQTLAFILENINISYYGEQFIDVISNFSFTVTLLIVTAFSVVRQVMLGKAFGKSIAFTLGLVVLRPIFMLILAFGKSKYKDNTLEK